MRLSHGVIGLILGAIAVGAALVHITAGPFSFKHQVKGVLTTKLVKLGDDVADALKREKKNSSIEMLELDSDQAVTIGSASAAVLGIVLALIALARPEERRLAALAMALGGTALAIELFNWHSVMG